MLEIKAPNLSLNTILPCRIRRVAKFMLTCTRAVMQPRLPLCRRQRREECGVNRKAEDLESFADVDVRRSEILCDELEKV